MKTTPHINQAKAISAASNRQVNIKSRGFTMHADEPTWNGGDNQFPAPMDYISSGLAACTVNYLRYQAEKKQIATGEITVKVTLKKDANAILFFERQISFHEPITEQDKIFLLKQSENTPVTKVLQNGITILNRIFLPKEEKT